MNIGYNKIVMGACDLGEGEWVLDESANSANSDGSKTILKNDLLSKRIHLKSSLIEFKVVSDKNDRTFGGTVSAGIVGAVALGPLGGIAGALYGGKRDKETIVYGKLSDGKTFVGTCDSTLVPKLFACVTNNPVLGVSIEDYSSKEKDVIDKGIVDATTNEVKGWSYVVLIALPLLPFLFLDNILFTVAGGVIDLILIVIFFTMFGPTREELGSARNYEQELKRKEQEFDRSFANHARLRNEERNLFESGDKDALWKCLDARADQIGAKAFFDLACSHILGHAVLLAESGVAHFMEKPSSTTPCLTREESYKVYFPVENVNIESNIRRYFDSIISGELSADELVKLFDTTIFNKDVYSFKYVDKNNFDFLLIDKIFDEVKKIASKEPKIGQLMSKYQIRKAALSTKRVKLLRKKNDKAISEGKLSYRVPFQQLEVCRECLDDLFTQTTSEQKLKEIDIAKKYAEMVFPALTKKTRAKRELEFDHQVGFLETLNARQSLNEYIGEVCKI